MKNLLLLATIGLLSTSCGVSESLRDDCGSDIEMGCNVLFGYKNKDQDEKIASINPSTEKVTITQICPNFNPTNIVLLETLLKVEKISGQIEYMAFLADNVYTNERLVKLNENTQFSTTDGRSQLFKIVNGNIICN